MNPFTEKPELSVASLGEERLIQSIRGWLGDSSPSAPFGIGDDCAVMPAGRSAQLITVDPVIYGRHFDDTVLPRHAGGKLFKRNLSDIAAMGGSPRAAVVALALDPSVKITWLRNFYLGLAAMSRRYAVPVVGGDVAQTDGGIVATLTLLGEAHPRRVLTRKGARMGDVIYVTGRLGGSLPTGHHYQFTPRLAEGAWLVDRTEVRSMMDVSDGLAKDLRSLAPEGSVPALSASALPCRRGYDTHAALCDGEDFELVFSVNAKADLGAFENAFTKAFPKTRLSRIGRFVSPDHFPAQALDLRQFRGFEHLR